MSWLSQSEAIEVHSVEQGEVAGCISSSWLGGKDLHVACFSLTCAMLSLQLAMWLSSLQAGFSTPLSF